MPSTCCGGPNTSGRAKGWMPTLRELGASPDVRLRRVAKAAVKKLETLPSPS